MNNVDTLQQNGYTVNSTGNTIAITSKTPFNITKGKRKVSAHRTDEGYSLSVDGLVINGTVPFVVEGANISISGTTKYSLLESLLSKVDTPVRTNLKPFFSVGINETFKIVGDQTVYVRTGPKSYHKHTNLVSVGQDITVTESFDVTSEDWYSLTPEQVRDLAEALPPHLGDSEEIYDEIYNMLEDVPGMEDQEAADKAANLIFNMYISIDNDRA